jgi:glycosyltransferase involved in cell wall biosynthesis
MVDMKVAIIEPVGGHGGMDYYDFGLCKGLTSAGVNPVLYTCEETSVEQGLPFSVKLTYKKIFGKDTVWLRGVRYLMGSFKAMYHARRSGTRICHFHFFHVGPLELFNVVFARALGMRVVVTAHDVNPFAENLSVPFFVDRAYRMAGLVIVHNYVSRKELVESVGVPSDKIVVIPHGNYLHALGEIPSRRRARQRLGLPVDARVLLFFGQIKEVKGLDLLLKALPAVIEKFSDTVLVIAGKVWKDDFNQYKKIIDAHALSPHLFTRIQYIDNADVPLYFSAADLVVLPYKRIYQSGVILMAMSYGKSVLASDIEGMREIIGDGITGFLFRANSVHDLSRRIVDILSDTEKALAVAHKGREHVEIEYGWEKIGRLTARCYGNIDSN